MKKWLLATLSLISGVISLVFLGILALTAMGRTDIDVYANIPQFLNILAIVFGFVINFLTYKSWSESLRTNVSGFLLVLIPSLLYVGIYIMAKHYAGMVEFYESDIEMGLLSIVMRVGSVIGYYALGALTGLAFSFILRQLTEPSR